MEKEVKIDGLKAEITKFKEDIANKETQSEDALKKLQLTEADCDYRLASAYCVMCIGYSRNCAKLPTTNL